MKRILALLCLMVPLHSAGCAPMVSNPEQNRYVYCNVYTASACFALANGDVMTMRIPIDFVTYDLELLGGAKVMVYSGYNPSTPEDAGGSLKKYSTASGRYEYATTSDGKYVITYTPIDTGLPLLQIVAGRIDASQKKQFADFLSAFHSCKNDGHGVICNKEDELFKGVVEEILKK